MRRLRPQPWLRGMLRQALPWPSFRRVRRCALGPVARIEGSSSVAKIHAGEGPQVSAGRRLVGATGDLARRKLWPGLFHLATAGSSTAAGSSACRSKISTRRPCAPRCAARSMSSRARKVNAADWDAFAKNLDYVPLAAGRDRPQGGGRQGGTGPRRRQPPPALPERAAECGAVGSAPARRGRPRRALPHHHGKALRHRPCERGVAERASCTRYSRKSRSFASTISSARSRRRTSSRSASPTDSSSPSGTAISSTTCR